MCELIKQNMAAPMFMLMLMHLTHHIMNSCTYTPRLMHLRHHMLKQLHTYTPKCPCVSRPDLYQTVALLCMPTKSWVRCTLLCMPTIHGPRCTAAHVHIVQGQRYTAVHPHNVLGPRCILVPAHTIHGHCQRQASWMCGTLFSSTLKVEEGKVH